MLSIVRPQKQPAPKRQAIFVLDHEIHGRVVINRKVFERLLRRPANEARPGGDLVKTADLAMQKLLGSDMFSLEKMGMFSLRGLSMQPTEFTVFLVEPDHRPLLRLINATQCTKVEDHPLRNHINQYLEQQPAYVAKRRGLG